MGIEHNAHQVAQNLTRKAAAWDGEVSQFLDNWGERVAGRMKARAPKFQSTLTNSIRMVRESKFTRFVGPQVDHAKWVEAGRKPGKGLPRFLDPAGQAAQAWLRGHVADEKRGLHAKWRPGRIGSGRRQQEETELRDRYMAWSRSVKLHGIKAQPFVKPTADEMRPQILAGAQALVQTLVRGS
jgi:hypothetical protein